MVKYQAQSNKKFKNQDTNQVEKFDLEENTIIKYLVNFNSFKETKSIIQYILIKCKENNNR